MALQFEARKIAMKQDRTGFVLTISIHPDELPVELMRDFVGTRYGCAMVRIQDDETATQYNNRAQQSAILCKNPKFQEFIGGKDEASTASLLCARLGILSRSELNGNKTAQDSFDLLKREFEEFDNDLF